MKKGEGKRKEGGRKSERNGEGKVTGMEKESERKWWGGRGERKEKRRGN